MPQEMVTILLALAAFGVFHSVTAALGFKALMVSLLGQRAYLGLYRLLYNMVSVITLLPILAWALAETGKTIWALDEAIALIFMVLQLVGVVGAVVSLVQIDFLRFVGLKQLFAYLNDDTLPLPDEPLTFKGLYHFTRHPLYFFTLMALWFNPTMTASGLGLALGATLYFSLGSWVEERKLVRAFGQPYVDYQKRVAWLIPFVKLPSR